MNQHANLNRWRAPWLGLAAALVMVTPSCAPRPPAATKSEAASTSQRTIPLAEGGSITVERMIDGDRVEHYDKDGELVGQSLCDKEETGSYQELVALFRQFKTAVLSGNQRSVAALIRFPLQVNGENDITIANAPALKQRYAQIFNAEFRKKISVANPQVVFCRYDGAMFGDGLVWGHSEGGRTAIDVVNH